MRCSRRFVHPSPHRQPTGCGWWRSRRSWCWWRRGWPPPALPGNMTPQLQSWVRGGLVIVATTLLVAARHPMHTAVAELSHDARRGTTAILIRVFVDDWAAAVPVPPGTPGADSAMARYVRDPFTLADRSGRHLPLQWERGERAGDVVVLRLPAPASDGLGGMQVTSA